MNGENRIFPLGCQGKSDRTTFQPCGTWLERRRQALHSVANGSRSLLDVETTIIQHREGIWVLNASV